MHKLRVIIIGHLDLRVGFELMRLCASEEGVFTYYEFDFERRPSIRDSGLAWLLMFARLARSRGQYVRITNLDMELARRLVANGGLAAELEVAEPRKNCRASLLPERPGSAPASWSFSAL